MSTETTVVETTPEVVETEVVEATVVETIAVVDAEMKEKSDSFLTSLVKNKDDAAEMISNMGEKELFELQKLSDALKLPLSKISDSDTDVITNGLLDMKMQVDAVSPSNFNFSPGFIGKFIYKITGSTAVGKYVNKFSTAESVITSISNSLTEGAILLKEDNVIFKDDKKRYILASESLSEKVKLLAIADTKIDEEVELMPDSEDKVFLQKEVSFRIKQQMLDLKQTQIVTQQGVIALDILIKNNDELQRSVKRVKNVTMAALSIGATLAVGLSNQKKVLDIVTAVNEGTSDVIAGNAKLLQTQGASIQKQASGSMLNIEKLQSAITDTLKAIEDVESFKIKALPEMRKAISQLGEMTDAVDEKIKHIKDGDELNLLPTTEAKGA